MINSDQQWLLAGAESPARPKTMVNSPKAMAVRFWPPVGFPVIQALRPNMTLTSKFIADNIFPEIVVAKPSCDPYRRLVLQMDNASSPGRCYPLKNGKKTELGPTATQGSHPALHPPTSLSPLY
jgi:hypothetical protein